METSRSQTGIVSSLYRYPVKGLSGDKLEMMPLSRIDGLSGDRRWALLLPGIDFDPQHPEPLPKTRFLMLARHERLASVRSEVVDNMISIRRQNDLVVAADLLTESGRETIEEFFAKLVGLESGRRPRLVQSHGHRFTDISIVSPVMMRAISLINLRSVQTLAQAVGQRLDPLRFRANIYLDGLPAWAEVDLRGRQLRIGEVIFKVLARIPRCAAVEVNPATGIRDIDLVKRLFEITGEAKMGLYLEVCSDGAVQLGDSFEVIGEPASMSA